MSALHAETADGGDAGMHSAGTVYTAASAALVAAIVLRWVLDPLMGDNLPLVTLFGAVAAAVWIGGYRPAVLVSALGYLACDYLFIEPRGQLGIFDVGHVVGLLAYVFTCTVIIAFGEAARLAQRRSNQRRELLQVTLRSIGDAVITTDVDGRVTYLNAVAELLTGWTPGEAIGQHLEAVFRIVNEDTRQPVTSPATRALREGVVVGLANHTVLIQKNGSERPIDDSAAPIRDELGKVTGCVLIFRDVTTQRRMEQEKARQLMTARLLAAIVESTDDAVISKSLDGVIQSWNAAATRLFGHTAEHAIGRHISLIIPPDRLAEEDHIIAKLRGGERIEHFETERLHADGRNITVSLTISPVQDETGQVVGASKIARDVSLQRTLEQRERDLLAAAVAANAKFHAFFEQGALFAVLMDITGTVLEANRLSWDACGYSKEQIIGRPLWEGPWWAASPELMNRLRTGTAETAAGQYFRAELPYVVADGSERVAAITIQPIRDDTGRVLLLALSGSDITERKRAEADREKFVTLVENSTDFIAMCDLNGIPFFVNRAGLAMIGLDDLEQARRTSVADFFFPEDRQRIIEELLPSVLEHGHGEVDVRFRHFKTGEARWMAYKVLSLPDETGRPIAIATVSQDVTERRQFADSLRSLAADLSEADRRKNEFLAMLAHELRNPLAPISNAARALRLAASDGAAAHPAAEMLERQVGQMSRLVDDLLDMSRITRGKIELRKERIALAPIVNHAVEAVRGVYRSLQHELTVTLPSEAVYLDADPTRVAQIVGNLLNNAGKFTDRGGHVWLSVERAGGEAVIRVRDNGIGIEAEQRARIFEMFTQVDTSLERSRDGLGIGLTLVKTLVEMQGGMVEAFSDGLGRGSEFVVRLPVVGDAAGVVTHTGSGEPSPGTRRRILIVDDNEDGAESLALLLELGGHETYKAHDGEQAIEAAERLRPDAVLLDIGLPGMNGYEVCRQIRRRPWGKDIFLVALTGWGQEEDRQRSEEAGFDEHMVKPADHDVLMHLLASAPRRRPGASQEVGADSA